jgi:hypothetical protein
MALLMAFALFFSSVHKKSGAKLTPKLRITPKNQLKTIYFVFHFWNIYVEFINFLFLRRLKFARSHFYNFNFLNKLF